MYVYIYMYELYYDYSKDDSIHHVRLALVPHGHVL